MPMSVVAPSLESSLSRRYRPKYQRPEELLQGNSAVKRFSRHRSDFNSTATPSSLREHSPDPIPDSKAGPAHSAFQLKTPVRSTFQSNTPSSGVAKDSNERLTSSSAVFAASSSTPGPVVTDDWVRPFMESHPVETWTPRRRVLDPAMLAVATPRSGRASLAPGTPAALAAMDRRKQSSHHSETVLFGTDFEDIARKRQALYLAEEGNVMMRAAAAGAMKNYVSPHPTRVANGNRPLPASSPASQPSAVTFLDILAEKKRRERVRSGISENGANSAKQQIHSDPSIVDAASNTPAAQNASTVLSEYLRLISRKPAVSSSSQSLLFSSKTYVKAVRPSSSVAAVQPHYTSPSKSRSPGAAEDGATAHVSTAALNVSVEEEVVDAASILGGGLTHHPVRSPQKQPSVHLTTSPAAAPLPSSSSDAPSEDVVESTLGDGNRRAQLVQGALSSGTTASSDPPLGYVERVDSSLEAFHSYVSSCAGPPPPQIDVRHHDHQIQQTLQMFGSWFSDVSATTDSLHRPARPAASGIELLMQPQALAPVETLSTSRRSDLLAIADAVIMVVVEQYLLDRCTKLAPQ